MHRKPLFCSTGLYILFPELFARDGMFRVRVGSTAFSMGRRSASAGLRAVQAVHGSSDARICMSRHLGQTKES